MYDARAYAAASATSPLASTKITRREPATHDVQIELNNPVLELNEAAYLLGYDDANSFIRAFRTWEGVPPARWREQQRMGAVS